MSRKACGRPRADVGGIKVCLYERMAGKQQCMWHWLMRQSATAQQGAAQRRLQAYELVNGAEGHRARVPASEWPIGERWCAGCQSFVPLFYTTGSRCKSCASTAAHAGAIERAYGISREDYDALLELQGGRCYICRRKPQTKRLAVDHDHRTGLVRGLLCANNENGCNRGVVANLEAAADGGLAAARRAVEYLEHPPYERLKGHPKPIPPVPGPQSSRAVTWSTDVPPF